MNVAGTSKLFTSTDTTDIRALNFQAPQSNIGAVDYYYFKVDSSIPLAELYFTYQLHAQNELNNPVGPIVTGSQQSYQSMGTSVSFKLYNNYSGGTQLAGDVVNNPDGGYNANVWEINDGSIVLDFVQPNPIDGTMADVVIRNSVEAKALDLELFGDPSEAASRQLASSSVGIYDITFSSAHQAVLGAYTPQIPYLAPGEYRLEIHRDEVVGGPGANAAVPGDSFELVIGVNAVPEPGSAGLLGLACTGALAIRRRKRNV